MQQEANIILCDNNDNYQDDEVEVDTPGSDDSNSDRDSDDEVVSGDDDAEGDSVVVFGDAVEASWSIQNVKIEHAYAVPMWCMRM